MKRSQRKRQRRKVRHKGRGQYAFLSVVLIIAFAITAALAAAIFCKIDTIEVEGNSMYSDEEIISASGLKTGGNILSAILKHSGKSIENSLDYVFDAAVKVKLPTNVTIIVNENKTVARIAIGGKYWQLSKDCTALASGSSDDALIKIIGFDSVQAKQGNVLTVSDEEQTKLDYLKALLSAIELKDVQSNITEIDMTNIGNITFDYLGRFTVKLGSGDDAEYKIDKMIRAVAQLEAADTGTLNLSKDGETRFVPYSENT